MHYTHLLSYPNPVVDVLHLDNLLLSKASVYSVLGQLIASETFAKTLLQTR